MIPSLDTGQKIAMDNIRLILIAALVGVLYLIYAAWMQDYGQASLPVVSGSAAVPASADVPAATPALPTVGTSAAPLSGTVDSAPIIVETDVLKAEISLRGGTIQNLWLLRYVQRAETPDAKFQLLKAETPNFFIVQSGLLSAPGQELPTHESLFTATRGAYRLGVGDDELIVELTWKSETGIEVIKRYRFERGQYVVRVTQEVRNLSDQPIVARRYAQLQRTDLHDPNESNFISTYTGGVYYGPESKYKKQAFKDMTKQALDVTITDGWIAMIQHYFMAAWIPPVGQLQHFYTKVVNDPAGESRYIIGKYSEPMVIAAGASHAFVDRLFVGPKLQNTLASIAPGLELTVDYGWLTIIAQPIFWLLEKLHALFGNWGWAIIVLTILIKLAFYKLSEASYKSMAGMRKLAPRMKAIKDRYGDDKERFNQAVMELYQKEKINPLGGCLPILVQIPVFIALYWVLLESVELRHAPFIFWLTNLTAPDPYYVLPLVMGVSMFVQQKLSPPPPDPIQEKIIMTLPVVFTIFFAFFPAGLVLYWTVNNLLSIAQQWYITNKIEQEDARKK